MAIRQAFGERCHALLFPDGSITIEPETALSNVERHITLDPPNNQFGEAVVIITVTDGPGSYSDQFPARVISVNDAPIVTPIDNHSTIVDELYSITVTAMDVEGDDLTYSLLTTIEGMDIDEQS